jgi:hypothetical protein
METAAELQCDLTELVSDDSFSLTIPPYCFPLLSQSTTYYFQFFATNLAQQQGVGQLAVTVSFDPNEPSVQLDTSYYLELPRNDPLTVTASVSSCHSVTDALSYRWFTSHSYSGVDTTQSTNQFEIDAGILPLKALFTLTATVPVRLSHSLTYSLTLSLFLPLPACFSLFFLAFRDFSPTLTF